MPSKAVPERGLHGLVEIVTDEVDALKAQEARLPPNAVLGLRQGRRSVKVLAPRLGPIQGAVIPTKALNEVEFPPPQLATTLLLRAKLRPHKATKAAPEDTVLSHVPMVGLEKPASPLRPADVSECS